MKNRTRISIVFCLIFFFALSSLLPSVGDASLNSETHFDPNWWYTADDKWINITKTAYKLSIPVTGRTIGGITLFYWNKGGKWINAANANNQVFFVETEFAEFALTKLHNNSITILKKTEDIFSFLVKGETAEWEAYILYVFYADRDWFYAEGFMRAKKAWSGGVQNDIIWATDFYDDSQIYLLSANESVILWNSVPRSWPLMFGNSQFPWECYRRKADGFTIGVIFLDVMPRAGIHIEGTPEQQISWHTGGYVAENQTFSSKVIIYPYIDRTNDFYKETADLSTQLCTLDHIPVFEKLDHYAYGMEGPNWDLENDYVHFGTYEDWPHLGYSFGYEKFVHGWPAESIEIVVTNSTTKDYTLPSFTKSDSQILYPETKYPPTSSSEARHPWTIASDYVKIRGVQQNDVLSANHTAWIYADSDKVFIDVQLIARNRINVTSLSAEFNMRLIDWIEKPWGGSTNPLNSTVLALSWHDYDLMKDVSVVYIFGGLINMDLDPNLQRLRLNILNMTEEKTFEPGQIICDFQLTYLFTEKRITDVSQIDLNPHTFENVSSIYSGNSWFYRDVELKPQTQDFSFYTNSTILWVNSSADEDLEMTVWGQLGQKGIYYVISSYGLPSFVRNENYEYLNFSYNDSMNMCIFEVDFSEKNMQTITVEWNRKAPKEYLFNFLPQAVWKTNQSGSLEILLENQDDFSYTDLYVEIDWRLEDSSVLEDCLILPDIASGEQFREKYWTVAPALDGNYILTLSLRYVEETIANSSTEIEVLRGTDSDLASISINRMVLLYAGMVFFIVLIMLVTGKLNNGKRKEK